MNKNTEATTQELGPCEACGSTTRPRYTAAVRTTTTGTVNVTRMVLCKNRATCDRICRLNGH